MKILWFIMVIGGFSACSNTAEKHAADTKADEAAILEKINRIKVDMSFRLIPAVDVFEEDDSVRLYVECLYKDSALCCGTGEVFYRWNDSLDLDRVYTDTTYEYGHCWCNDSLILAPKSAGEYTIHAVTMWHKGDWSIGKDWSAGIHVQDAKKP